MPVSVPSALRCSPQTEFASWPILHCRCRLSTMQALGQRQADSRQPRKRRSPDGALEPGIDVVSVTITKKRNVRLAATL
jgi:hypothetical protein